MLPSSIFTRILLVFMILLAPFSDFRSPNYVTSVTYVQHYLTAQSKYDVIVELLPNVIQQANKNADTHKSIPSYKFMDRVVRTITVSQPSQTNEQPDPTNSTDPDDRCKQDVSCYGSYLTFKSWTEKVQLPDKISIIQAAVGVTILSEYWIVIGQNSRIIHYTIDGTSLRELGKEALARNLYEACGNVDIVQQCSYSNLYRFLSGFSPWIGRQHSNDDCSLWEPSERYADRKSDKLKVLYEDFIDDQYITDDVSEILNYDMSVKTGWASGAQPDRPWQWLNTDHAPTTLGYDKGSEAIMYVDVLQNSSAYKYAVFFTFYQTYNR